MGRLQNVSDGVGLGDGALAHERSDRVRLGDKALSDERLRLRVVADVRGEPPFFTFSSRLCSHQFEIDLESLVK